MSRIACTSLSSWSVGLGGTFVHIVASTFLAGLFWLALLAWVSTTGAEGDVLVLLILTPLIISGFIIFLTVVCLLWVGLRWLWLGRATLRLWRSH